jgi:ketosteroid isomerase-like protein
MSGPISALGLPHSAERDLPPWIAAFYRAYVTRDPALLAAILDDDVEWIMTGPAEQFDIYGSRRGKKAALELLTRIMPCFYSITDYEIDHLLLQDDRVAAYGNVRARQRETGRSLCFRAAQFLRFRHGKLVAFRGIADTFDMAEQMLGHPIDVTRPVEHVALAPEQDELLSL